MSNNICTYCGAHLDNGERCDCIESMYMALAPENRAKVDIKIAELLAEQRKGDLLKRIKNAAPALAHRDGKSETTPNDFAVIVHG